jgi:hypothetical protein
MISLSLAKLSTAQDAYPDEQTFRWKHETNNLICVIDSYQAGGSALQLMKVVQGTQVRVRATTSPHSIAWKPEWSKIHADADTIHVGTDRTSASYQRCAGSCEEHATTRHRDEG